MKKKEKQPKLKTAKFWILNTKFLPAYEERPEMYLQAFKDIASRRILYPIASDKNMLLRGQYPISFSYKGKSYDILYGYISQCTRIDPTVPWFNYETNEPEKGYELPAYLFPNLKETRYIFIPACHKFVIIQNGKISLTYAQKYLEAALTQVVSKGISVVINTEKTTDYIEILNSAQKISRLDIHLSMSNPTTDDEAEALIDMDIRAANASSIDLGVKSFEGGTIDYQASSIIKGAIKHSQSNGSLQATIVTSEGKHKRIDTNEYPRTERVEYAETASLIHHTFLKIMNIFGH